MTKRATRLPKLDRLLLDTDVNPLVGRYLQVLGFNVVYAQAEGIDVRDDVAILRHANRHYRIMVTHDRFKDARTKRRIYRHLYESGGSVIQVGGAAKQSPLEALGRLLIHREDWLAFFQQNDGVVVLSRERTNKLTRAECHTKYQYRLKGVQVAGIAPKARRPRKKAARPKHSVTDQQHRLEMG